MSRDFRDICEAMLVAILFVLVASAFSHTFRFAVMHELHGIQRDWQATAAQ